ncbi:phage tail fiber protein [Salinicola sp. V024]|uniref:phage tail fiber protein n=1 Tax=Salinicola sp. V024 TaxID=3459609 RepID=UPI004044E6BA
MADTINVQNANDWLGEVESRAHELVDVLKAGVDVANAGKLGNLSLFDSLSSAPVGSASTLRSKIGFESSVLTEIQKFGIGSADGKIISVLSDAKTPGIYAIDSATTDPDISRKDIYSCLLATKRYGDFRYLWLSNNGNEPEARIQTTYNGSLGPNRELWHTGNAGEWNEYLKGRVSITSTVDPFWGDQITTCGKYNISSSYTDTPLFTNMPFNWAQIISLARSPNRAGYLAVNSLGSNPRLAVGILNSDVDTGATDIPSNAYVWAEVLSSNNTTTDSNGFIKSASPIFRLANDALDAAGDGFTLDNCGAYNSEAQGVSASHDDVGVYTVSGSLGFASDGWTIEIPQDVNGNRLCFVETETAEDKTITVRTFSRKFDFNTAMIVAGDPVDIPDGRWIDLRLSMPVDEPEESAEIHESEGRAPDS